MLGFGLVLKISKPHNKFFLKTGDSAYLDDRVVYGLWAENNNLTEIKQRYRKSLYDPGIFHEKMLNFNFSLEKSL